MELKTNDATPNRPDGGRVLDAPYVFADLGNFIDQLHNEKAWDSNDRNAITVFKSPELTIVLLALREGAGMAANFIDGLVTIQVMQGKVLIKTDEKEIPGVERNLIAFHPEVMHSVVATTHTVLLLTNYTSITTAD